MADVLQVAKQRRSEYEKQIAAKEAEIADIREMIADLESFIDFGASLVDGKSEPAKPEATKEPNLRAVSERPKVNVQAEKPAAKDDRDDEWPDADENAIAQVLAAHKS